MTIMEMAEVSLDPPASRIPAIEARKAVLERLVSTLNAEAAACALACAEGKAGSGDNLEKLRAALASASFELSYNGAAQDLARAKDTEALAAWRMSIQTLPADRIIEGITKDQCCRRCRSGDCVIVGADDRPGDCAHPALFGPLHLLRHLGNPRILAVYAAAVAKVGKTTMTETVDPTPAEATARLNELKANGEWSKGFLAGDGPKVAEFNKLTEIASRVDKIGLAMTGTFEDKMVQDSGHIDNVRTAEFLRGSGIDDPAIIRQVLTGEKVSAEEFEAAKSMKTRLMRDHDFQRRYLSGDGEAVRQMGLLNVVLTRDVKSA